MEIQADDTESTLNCLERGIIIIIQLSISLYTYVISGYHVNKIALFHSKDKLEIFL